VSRVRVNKDVRALLEAADEQPGWRYERVKDAYMFYAPDGVGIVTVHLTEGNKRAMKNSIARLRAHGFKWRGR